MRYNDGFRIGWKEVERFRIRFEGRINRIFGWVGYIVEGERF